MTTEELLALLAAPEVRDQVIYALRLPSDSVSDALRRLEDAHLRTAEGLDRLAKGAASLADAQAGSEKRLEQLAKAVKRSEESQEKTDKRIAELAKAQRKSEQALQKTDKRLEQLADVQLRSDKQLARLSERVERLTEHFANLVQRCDHLAMTTEALADAQRQSAASQPEIAKALVTVSESVGFGLEELAAIMLPDVLATVAQVRVNKLSRKRFTTDAGQEEVALFAEGTRGQERVSVVGDVKSRILEPEVRTLSAKARRVGAGLDTPVVPVLFGFAVHPEARSVASELGVHVVASRPG